MIHQLGVSDAYLNDPLWGSELDELPDGSFVMISQMKNALNGDSFFYFPVGEKRAVKVGGVSSAEFVHYMSIFNNSENFGLPHGRGWIHELPWVLDFLTMMKSAKSEIEMWHMRKA